MQTLLTQFRTSTNILKISLDGLPDHTARVRTRGTEGPSISWTLGHLLDSRIKALALLGAMRSNPWTAHFRDAAATDGNDYPSLADMLAEWELLHAAIESACATAADAIDAPAAGASPHGESKVRDQLAFLAWHEGYHLGVIGAARKAAGLLGPAELVRAASRI